MAEEAGASKKPKKYTGILLHPTSLPGLTASVSWVQALIDLLIFWNVRD